jgi:hypothetical protein
MTNQVRGRPQRNEANFGSDTGSFEIRKLGSFRVIAPAGGACSLSRPFPSIRELGSFVRRDCIRGQSC